MNDPFTQLGLTLQQDFQNWLNLDELGMEIDWAEQADPYSQIESDLIDYGQVSEAFLSWLDWLTSGFLPEKEEQIAAFASPELSAIASTQSSFPDLGGKTAREIHSAIEQEEGVEPAPEMDFPPSPAAFKGMKELAAVLNQARSNGIDLMTESKPSTEVLHNSQEAMVQESIIQESVVQKSIVQESMVQKSTVQEASTLESMVQEAIAQEAIAQEAMVQASRPLPSPAPDWKSGLTKRSPLKGTESQYQNLESRLPDFAPLAPISNPGRGEAIGEMPAISAVDTLTETRSVTDSAYSLNSSQVKDFEAQNFSEPQNLLKSPSPTLMRNLEDREFSNNRSDPLQTRRNRNPQIPAHHQSIEVESYSTQLPFPSETSAELTHFLDSQTQQASALMPDVLPSRSCSELLPQSSEVSDSLRENWRTSIKPIAQIHTIPHPTRLQHEAMPSSPLDSAPLDLDTFLEALQQEINQDYDRYYGGE